MQNVIFDVIFERAKADKAFKTELINAYKSSEPLMGFCDICTKNGIPVTAGDIITLGEEYSCNQLKSTNGGGVIPYDYYDDPFEMLMSSIMALS